MLNHNTTITLHQGVNPLQYRYEKFQYLKSLPTFIIAECVLIYLDPTATGAIVSWASQKFSTAVFFLYEQVESTLLPSAMK
jgi:O-methyltransferase involved in polyketide biosynthesis